MCTPNMEGHEDPIAVRWITSSPLELGGTNDMKDLWPEPYEPLPGSTEKDQLENSFMGRFAPAK
jgi:hypothetical protein